MRSSRRDFLRQSLYLGAAAAVAPAFDPAALGQAAEQGPEIAFGLVTYIWGMDLALPDLLKALEKAKVLGVELRTERAHKVEPSLGAGARAEVRKRFEDSPVQLVGLGTNEAFHWPDPKQLAAAIEKSKAFIRLSHDVGGTGVKVKPNDLPKGVPQEKTTEQIGKALNVLGAFGADFGQQIRLEVHGGCAPLPIIKQIMDVADHPNVGVCWNSNADDLKGPGLEANFNLVRKRFGATAHVRRLESKDYPFAELIRLFVKSNYNGWILLEAHDTPKDLSAALVEQRERFAAMLAAAEKT